MHKRTVIFGFATAIIICVVIMRPSKQESMQGGRSQDRVSEKISSGKPNEGGSVFSGIEGNFEQMEQVLDSDVKSLEILEDNSLRQESKLVARKTAHMSIEEMAKFQRLRRGEIVRQVNGTLNSPYVLKEQCLNGGDCVTSIINSRTGSIVWDGSWLTGLQPTGVGQEVVMIK